MARGDIVLFNEFLKDCGTEYHLLSSDSYKCAFVDNTKTPVATEATPTWSDFSANEVTGTGYTAGGQALDSVTWTESSGTVTFNAVDEVFAQNASGPTDIYWAIVYNDTHASKPCVCAFDMGGPVSMQAGPVTMEWHTNGICRFVNATT